MVSLFDNGSPESGSLPGVLCNDPANRHIKVICLGAGIMGIMNSYNIQKHCKNVELVVYEKNADIGGTWYENRYPGCACDVPSHSYAFHFAPNPDWPRYLSGREQIWSYLDRVCTIFDLRKFMKFSSSVTSARWDEKNSQWRIHIVRTLPNGTTEEFDDTCDLFILASGVLNHWEMPKIDGLETFQGKIIHTAQWPQEYDQGQWSGQKVLVIGSGASSLQIVPKMQPGVRHMDIFVRTGVWFAPLSEVLPEDYVYTEEEKAEFRNDPQKLIAHIKTIENQLNRAWPGFFKDSQMQTQMRTEIGKHMEELIKDPYLLKGFTPDFSVGCRRVTPGKAYLEAIQQPNVDVHFTAVDKVMPTGVIGADGILREGDTLICATGFDVSFRPRFPIIGRGGLDLRDKWATEAYTYMGLTVPDMPNLLTMPGPPTPVQNGTPFGSFHALAHYALQVIKKMQLDNINTFEPKESITEAFRSFAASYHENTVFSDSCRSWYKNNESGKVIAVWPGSAVQFMEVIKEPRWEHYEIGYREPDKLFAFLGNGLVKEIISPEEDASYYLTVDKIDPLWMEHCQKR